ncbi:hypothetical protein [Phaeodactylibacter luteus]|uniref:Restriction endonuclease n=1 Tax=Phaeodactylibacter luteus TaxID=1564516 RepID=A0A5C6RIU3_9BACT|nr:hypothetical protein [Phaeodactylibacter luteus]TXB61845.1 hypothetical protein FRY97_17235 [Phaeodactylibacter luteus]
MKVICFNDEKYPNPKGEGDKDLVIETYNLFRESTILDAELLVWNLSSTYYFLPVDKRRPEVYTVSNLDYYKPGLERRRKEIKEFLERGRVIIIQKPYVKPIILKTEEGEELTLDFYSFMGIEKPIIETVSGDRMTTRRGDEAKVFLSKHSHLLVYENEFIKSYGKPLFFINDTDHIVGQYIIKERGVIIFMPTIRNLDVSNVTRFFYDLHSFALSLKNDLGLNRGEFLMPEWAYGVQTKEEVSLRKRLDEIEKLGLEIKREIDLFEKQKTLFTGTGFELVEIVEYALRELGFNVVAKDTFKDDLIISKDDEIAIVEIKGVKKSATQRHAVRLHKWVTDYFFRHEVNPKGILIVNTYKDTPPGQRKEIDFPSQMMEYVNQMKICLMTGVELFILITAFKTGRMSQEEIEKLLFETVGQVKLPFSLEDLY